jgi:hypothetical protein
LCSQSSLIEYGEAAREAGEYEAPNAAFKSDKCKFGSRAAEDEEEEEEEEEEDEEDKEGREEGSTSKSWVRQKPRNCERERS